MMTMRDRQALVARRLRPTWAAKWSRSRYSLDLRGPALRLRLGRVGL